MYSMQTPFAFYSIHIPHKLHTHSICPCIFQHHTILANSLHVYAFSTLKPHCILACMCVCVFTRMYMHIKGIHRYFTSVRWLSRFSPKVGGGRCAACGMLWEAPSYEKVTNSIRMYASSHVSHTACLDVCVCVYSTHVSSYQGYSPIL